MDAVGLFSVSLQATGSPVEAAGASGFSVGWGTLALINMGLAQGKNRSALNWFLLSLLLGPLATLVLVAFFDKAPGRYHGPEDRDR